MNDTAGVGQFEGGAIASTAVDAWRAGLDRCWIAAIEALTSTAVVATFTISLAAIAVGVLYRTQPVHEHSNRRRALLGSITIPMIAAWWIAFDMPAFFAAGFVVDGRYSPSPLIALLFTVGACAGAPALMVRQLLLMVTGQGSISAAPAEGISS